MDKYFTGKILLWIKWKKSPENTEIKAKFKKYNKLSSKICLDCELNRQYIKKQSNQASNTYCLIVDKLWINNFNQYRN